LGDTVKLAAKAAYEGLEAIKFDGMQYRSDIGHRAFLKRD
jgi:phosphoribosylamine---glycine ligase